MEGGTEFALLYESPESLTRDGEFRVKFQKKFYQVYCDPQGGKDFCKFQTVVCHEGS